MTSHAGDREPLAIVGIGCRFPGGSSSPEAFWQLLREGRSGIREIPADRFSLDQFYDADTKVNGKTSTKYGGFVEGIRDFDAQFFGISPREAEAMDPQQRLVLMVVWEAFENAGIPADRLKGSNTSVFMGASSIDYGQIQRYRRTGGDLHAGTGSAPCIISNRVSHKFDFHGPSATIDTACSSSLTATDFACNSIWRGQSDLAVVGGVNVLLDPSIFISFSKANMLSKSGRVRAFDAQADGFVRAEGAGAVVLKPLSKAMQDRDRVYAVIRGTAVNQDGHTSTISVPSADAQCEMLSAACAGAELSPSDIDFVEAHGTGTPIGDPIEARAIGKVFGRERNRKARVLVGAVKTNTGHLEAGAGVTGVVKTALALYHRQIPRNLNFKTANPNIPLDDLGLELPLEHMEWRADNGRPRRAVVNSFGIGGTNACAVLEEAPAQPPRQRGHDRSYRNYWFVPLGAQSDKALADVAADTAKAIKAHCNGHRAAKGNGHAGANGTEPTFQEVAANLALRRSHLTFRAAALANTPVEIEKILKDAPRLIEAKKPRPGLITGKRQDEPRIAFVFAGQGGTWWGMAHGLLRDDAIFARAVDEFDQEFQKHSGWSVREELLRDEHEFHPGTTYTLPCLFALQTGLVARWRAWGIKPHMVLGHSSGELATAHAAGILSTTDAAKVVHHRSRLQATQEGRGGIAAIALPRHEVERHLAEWGMTNVDIAAVNGPSMVNIAGDNAALHDVVARLKERHGEDLFARVLKVDFAPHCHHMDPLRGELLESLAGVKPRTGAVPMISTVTGHLVLGQMADGMYWWRNIRDPVLFDQGLREALRLGANIFVEIGPHANLAPMIAGALAETGQSAVVVPSLNREEPYDKTLMTAAATLYVSGVEPDWNSICGETPPRIDLPRYPWEKTPFWIDTEEMHAALHGTRAHPLLGSRTFGPAAAWTSELSLEELTYLQDHAVDGSVIFPGAGYLEVMFAAGRELFGEGPLELENVEILEAMILSSERTEMVQTSYEPSRGRISIMSRPRGSTLDWTLRARAVVRLLTGAVPDIEDRIKRPRGKPLSGAAMYKKIAQRGYAYGPAFQGMRKIWPGQPEAVSWVQSQKVNPSKYLFHPALLDAGLQAGFGLDVGAGLKSKSGTGAEDRIYLPVRIERALFHDSPTRDGFWARARSVAVDHNASITDAAIEDGNGRRLLTLEGFTARAIPVRRGAVEGKALKPAYVIEEQTEIELKRSTNPRGGHGQTWLVFRGGAANDRAARAADALVKSGAKVIAVAAGARFSRAKGVDWHVDPEAAEQFEQLMEAIVPAKTKAKKKPKIDGIVFGWGLGAAERVKNFDATSLAANETHSSLAVLHLLQALAKRTDQKPRLWILTRGLHVAGTDGANGKDLASRLAGAVLAGFARTASSEYADLQPTLVDLDPEAKAARAQLKALAGVLLGGTEETEISLRGDKCYAPRTRQAEESTLPARTAPPKTAEATRLYRLTMTELGDLDNLRLVETAPVKPGKGEVKIAVKAGALNFHDILGATAMLPPEAERGNPAEQLGLECAGTIVEVGPGVKGKRVGDRVMAMGSGCFRSEFVVHARGALRLPKHMSFVDGATIPSVFSTVWYALTRQARLKAGETILVHLGTGGVGLAAIQIARYLKAKVISTAGSPEKRAYLKKLGIEHVFDSRSLAFAGQVRSATKGRGVDVVLNALAGDAISLGVSLLAPCGRFVEIGKRDIYSDTALGLRGLRSNASFHVLDMAHADSHDPLELLKVFDEILDLLEKRKLKALPAVTLPASRMIDAFKLLAKAKHIGKVVVDFEDRDLKIDLSAHLPLALSPKGAYLISGGLGGFGAETARWLAERGARHLYLMGRSGLSRPEARTLIADLKRAGVKAHALAADVTDPADVKAALARIAEDGLELKGVIHSAMVLDDGFITQLNRERMLKVLEPKVVGAWNLHTATVDTPLDFFVLFSSLASIFGGSGQANYAGANRFLDMLAEHRRRLGLPALAVNWGALGGAGAVQRNKQLIGYLKSMGLQPLERSEAFSGLGAMLRKDAPSLGLCKIDWRIMGRVNSGMRRIPRFADVTAAASTGGAGGRIRAELLAAKGSDRERLLKDYIGQQVARVLKIDAKTLDAGRPLNELGLDSLTSFQLKNKIESDVGISVPVGKFLQKPTVDILAKTIAELLETATSERREGGTAKAKGAARLMSARQEWLWHRLRKDGPMPMHGMMEMINAASIKPAINLESLQQAFHDTIARYEVLRSHFPTVEGEPRVEILPVERFVVQGVDAMQLDEAGFTDELRHLANTPHDLETGPLIDLRVFQRPDGENVLVLRSHVILGDAWSYSLVFRELMQRYFGLSPADDGKGNAYFDFTRWQRNWIAGQDGRQALRHWHEKLAKLPPPLKLGEGRPENVDPHARGSYVRRFVPASAGWPARERTRELGVSMHALFGAVYHALIHGVTDARDIVLSANVANRTRAEHENMVGWVANVVLTRCPVDPAATLREHAARLSQAMVEGMDHAGYPIHMVLDALDKTAGEPIAPHFAGFNVLWPDNVERTGFERVMFAPAGTIHRFGEIELKLLPVAVEGVGHFLNDTALTYQEVDGDLLFMLHARDGVFVDGGAQAYLDRFLRMLPEGLKNPDMTIGELARIG